MDSRKTTKNKLFQNVHHSRVPGPFWPKRVADRTPITTVGCVFRRGLKSGPREPKERKSAPARFLKALNKLGQKTEVHQTLCSTMRNCFRTQNGGPYFSKNDAPLQRKGPFGNLGELGTGSAFLFECCASNCEHSHGCPRSLCEAGKAQEPARTPPRAGLMKPKRP